MAKLVDDGFLDLKRELLAERYRGVGHDYDDVRGKGDVRVTEGGNGHKAGVKT